VGYACCCTYFHTSTVYFVASHDLYTNIHQVSQPNLGLTTKVNVYKVASQKGSSGIMSHAPGSAKECEGIDLYTPKGTLTLGVEVLVDSQIFKE